MARGGHAAGTVTDAEFWRFGGFDPKGSPGGLVSRCISRIGDGRDRRAGLAGGRSIYAFEFGRLRAICEVARGKKHGERRARGMRRSAARRLTGPPPDRVRRRRTAARRGGLGGTQKTRASSAWLCRTATGSARRSASCSGRPSPSRFVRQAGSSGLDTKASRPRRWTGIAARAARSDGRGRWGAKAPPVRHPTETVTAAMRYSRPRGHELNGPFPRRRWSTRPAAVPLAALFEAHFTRTTFGPQPSRGLEGSRRSHWTFGCRQWRRPAARCPAGAR